MLKGSIITEKERHTIKPFRGGNLGIIRLNHLSYPQKERIKITIGDREFRPIGFDTYGHPIISEDNFTYYKAQKSIVERRGESLVPVIEYEKKPFCIRKDVYDSVQGIEKAIISPKELIKKEEIKKANETMVMKLCKLENEIEEALGDSELIDELNQEIEELKNEFQEKLVQIEQNSKETNEEQILRLKSFKKLLIYRKQAAFCGKELNTFVVYNRYVLAPNGHIYICDKLEVKPTIDEQIEQTGEKRVVLSMEDIFALEYSKEVHIPGEDDVCAICGERFSIKDIEDYTISENEECLKVHTECLENFNEAVEHQKASEIIDSVYDGHPESEVISKVDEDGKKKTWYVYKTNQGTISIRFKRKVIVIEWHDNFKPFHMRIFDDERVTKYDRGIHAWSKKDAIRYLMMAQIA
ncbi:MAG: hypothetical protein ACI4UE_02635 [Candidatus Scatovivens sp.]